VQQVAMIYAGTQGLLDDVEVKDIRAFEDGYYPYLQTSQAQLMTDIETKKALDDDIKKRLTAAINQYKQDFLAAKKDAAKAETVKA
jgi:F-type H+-transporting ATPase subunit alpha